MLESKLSERKEKKELSVICKKVVVKGKGRDKSTERDSVWWKVEGREQILGEHHKRKLARKRG